MNKEKTVASVFETLTRAATLLEQDATSLRAYHTVRGRWLDDEAETRAVYDEQRQVAKALRSLAKYHKENPLGGPAKVFDAVADAIRAGDSVGSAMRAFDLKWADAKRKRPNV